MWSSPDSPRDLQHEMSRENASLPRTEIPLALSSLTLHRNLRQDHLFSMSRFPVMPQGTHALIWHFSARIAKPTSHEVSRACILPSEFGILDPRSIEVRNL